jgi:hypothetical protein
MKLSDVHLCSLLYLHVIHKDNFLFCVVYVTQLTELSEQLDKVEISASSLSLNRLMNEQITITGGFSYAQQKPTERSFMHCPAINTCS